MFATFKQIFTKKNSDIRKRILFTLICLFVFILGKAIVVPGIDKYSLGINQLGFLELINVMGGGALSQFSIFALGVMPYITASIIIELLASDIVPYLSDLKEEGGTGRAKLNKITRISGIALAFIQGYVYSFAYLGKGSSILNMDYLQFALVLTAGTCLLLWIGDQITKYGIGNGSSLLIAAGIITSIPKKEFVRQPLLKTKRHFRILSKCCFPLKHGYSTCSLSHFSCISIQDPTRNHLSTAGEVL